MPGRYWDEGHRSDDDRREYWREGEDIRSAPRERDRGGPERYAGTRDMDFGGGYGGGRDRGGERSSYERGGGREYLGGRRDLDDRWDRDRSEREGWERDRSGSRGGGSWGGGGQDVWRSEAGDFWERDSEGRLHDWSAEPRGGEGTRRSGGRQWGSAWGAGGAGYSARGAGFGGGGESGAQSWRGEWRGSDRDSFREGVSRLTGRGPKGYKRSDERIREDVCERIARSPVNAENVEVQVDNGEVTLSGEVDDRMDKRRLEDMIEDIFGVDEVHNHLRLRREAHRTGESTTEEHHGDDSTLSH